jgi:hypothetical protein
VVMAGSFLMRIPLAAVPRNALPTVAGS